jgi:hypothetical protein
MEQIRTLAGQVESFKTEQCNFLYRGENQEYPCSTAKLHRDLNKSKNRELDIWLAYLRIAQFAHLITKFEKIFKISEKTVIKHIPLFPEQYPHYLPANNI